MAEQGLPEGDFPEGPLLTPLRDNGNDCLSFGNETISIRHRNLLPLLRTHLIDKGIKLPFSSLSVPLLQRAFG
jgi:hypothetical protein